MSPESDAKRRIIHAAAIGEFSERGFAGTSMANIADAAGMSRPALYQYFRNKGDVFASAFVAMLDEMVDRALAALEEPGSTGDQLDGLLQRFEGDLWERMAASEHTDEIMSAKSDQVAHAVHLVIERLSNGVDAYLLQTHPGRSEAARQRRSGWRDLLHLAPKGCKGDQPDVETYRRRLTALAISVAADMDSD